MSKKIITTTVTLREDKYGLTCLHYAGAFLAFAIIWVVSILEVLGVW